MTTLFETFRHAAVQYGDKVALIDFHTGQQITYNGLFNAITQTAANLQAHYGVSPGDRAGILMCNQLEFIVSFFALQALGCVVIPLNYRLTPQEHLAIFENAGGAGLVANPDFEDSIQFLKSKTTWLIQTESANTDIPDINSWLNSDKNAPKSFSDLSNPNDVAVLIYTSGTTGSPKGVMLNHRNLIADAQANAHVIEVSPEDTMITCSPLFHVFGLTNIMLTGLFQGATIILVKRFNPKSILEAITKYHVTFLAAVPTMYQMMLNLLPSPAFDLSSLRICHSGAAPMHIEVFKQVEEYFGAPVQEGYGQSEASSIITSNPLTGPRKPGSIGKPLQGVTLEIIDDEDHPLSAYEVGELRVKGDTVMQGYWQNPEASGKALRNGWLYTSDMGYQDEDGYIFLAGRRDDLINVGGAKVYPHEVEEILYQHPCIQSCAVVAETSPLYHQVVAAYIVLKTGNTIAATDIQKHCRLHIAEFKVPKSVYFVEDIPKGPTGKILRHLLKPQ